MQRNLSSINNNFLCHIIRDIFPIRNNVGLYGDLQELKEEMLKPEHSIGSLLLHTNREKMNDYEQGFFWEIGINGPYCGYNCFDLFISINYNPMLLTNNYKFIAEQISALMKHRGIVLIVNGGLWSSEIDKYMTLRKDLINEAKRYTILRDKRVYIYENI